jgi:glycosyltransferase involved in cell wall biosynthesis
VAEPNSSALAVSVVLPTYNRAELLPRALDGVLAQDWPRAQLELLVIDDGSTDDTPDVLESFRRSHSETIRVLRQENAGPPAARNAGVRAARFPYIALLDSDDAWEREKLRRQMSLFAADPSLDFCFTAISGGGDTRAPGLLLDGWDEAPEEALERLLLGDCIVTSSVLLSRRLLSEVGPFDASLWLGDDYDLWLRVAEAGKRIAYIPEPLTIKFSHAGGISASSALVNKSYLDVLEKHFGDGLLPDQVQPRSRWFLARRYLNNASASIQSGEYRAAAGEILQAFRQRPQSARPGWLLLLARSLISAVASGQFRSHRPRS